MPGDTCVLSDFVSDFMLDYQNLMDSDFVESSSIDSPLVALYFVFEFPFHARFDSFAVLQAYACFQRMIDFR